MSLDFDGPGATLVHLGAINFNCGQLERPNGGLVPLLVHLSADKSSTRPPVVGLRELILLWSNPDLPPSVPRPVQETLFGATWVSPSDPWWSSCPFGPPECHCVHP
ncbi:Hypothetical predicted protein [Xyrichtys novacula]|uniref:Uncharacterized protein n=1 Tax=Xyrichtys novacula TaxID=13765 RepID=A0AAV1FEM2_XYRNO|nr:Hypothetical predicted protein [Xyrichtys novacula]